MRKLAIFAAAFGAAAGLACYVTPLHWLGWLGLGCALGALGCAFLPKGMRKRGSLLLLGLACGFLWFRGWTALFRGPADALAGTSAQVSAVVTDFPVQTAYGVRFEARLDRGAGVRCVVYADDSYGGLEPGDRLTFTARFQASDEIHGETSTYYTSGGVFLLAYADGEGEADRPVRVPLWTLPARWARALKTSLRASFPADASGLVTAVLLGDRDSLSDGDSAALSRSGLSHLAAVSGLHIGILAQGLLLLFRRHRRLAAAVAAPVLILFALLTGASPSVVRAVVMQLFLLLAPILGREGDSPTSLSAALLLLLLCNPYAAASVSLQLSFAAVAGILLVSGPIQELCRPLYRGQGEGTPRGLLPGAVRVLCASVSVTLGATLFTAPLSALYFGSVSLAGVLSNLLILPVASILFLLALLAALAGLLHPLFGGFLAAAAAPLARWVLWVARSLGGLAFASVSLEPFYYRVWFLAVYLLLGCVFFLGGKRPRPVLPVCAAVLLLCAAILFTRADYTAAPLTVSALDVGQGSSTALISRGVTALVDCGGNGPDNAGDVAADYFQSRGVSYLDLLVLTHFDSDHFNGVEQLFHRMDIAVVAIPQLDDSTGREEELRAWAQAEGAQVISVSALSGAALGSAELTFYPPLGSGSSNEAGLSLLCTVGDYDVLITGDADAAIESMLVKYFDLPDIELLIAGHHGARTSTSAELLAAVTPETAVISSGYNTYGHPAPETLARLEEANVAVYRTDRQGTVTVTVRDQ